MRFVTRICDLHSIGSRNMSLIMSIAVKSYPISSLFVFPARNLDGSLPMKTANPAIFYLINCSRYLYSPDIPAIDGFRLTLSTLISPRVVFTELNCIPSRNPPETSSQDAGTRARLLIELSSVLCCTHSIERLGLKYCDANI